MSTRPFTKRNLSRLWRVCNVIASRMCLSHLAGSYVLAEQDDSDVAYIAHSRQLYLGWEGRITIFPLFFTLDLHDQLLTLVHEHLHVAMMPQDQATDLLIRRNVPKREWSRAREDISVSREITVSCMQSAVLELLMPHIKKVL